MSALVTVRIEDADDPDAILLVNFQLMAAVPRVGDRLTMPDWEQWEVVAVYWRMQEQTGLHDLVTEADLIVRRVASDEADQ